MYEVLVQVCFMFAGLVNACTTGTVYTDRPDLVSSVAPVVYVNDAPRHLVRHYNIFSVPVPVIEYRRTYRARGIYKKHVRHHHHRPQKKTVIHKHVHHKKHKVKVKAKKKIKAASPGKKKHKKKHKRKKRGNR
jgi:hypothetical protein